MAVENVKNSAKENPDPYPVLTNRRIQSYLCDGQMHA
jgi:hypothetical protein